MNISTKIFIFESEYASDSPNSSILEAAKSGMGTGSIHETYFAAIFYNYQTLEYQIRHLNVLFTSFQTIFVGTGPYFKNVDSILAIDDSIFYMA